VLAVSLGTSMYMHLITEKHRRTSQNWAKPSFIRQKLNVLGRSQQPKMKKKLFLYLLNEKMEFILSSEIKCPKSCIFATSYWVG